MLNLTLRMDSGDILGKKHAGARPLLVTGFSLSPEAGVARSARGAGSVGAAPAGPLPWLLQMVEAAEGQETRPTQQGSPVHDGASGKRVLSCRLPDTLKSSARKEEGESASLPKPPPAVRPASLGLSYPWGPLYAVPKGHVQASGAPSKG